MGSKASVIGIVLCIVCAGSGAQAANYHSGDTLNCTDCHLSHASASHTDGGQITSLQPSPSSYLTKASSISRTCLRCHNDQAGTPDVLGADINNPSEQYDGSERAAGQFGDGESDNWRGHNLSWQGTSGPGECTACHDPHGNSNYRNLKLPAGSSGDPLAFVNPSATGLERFSRSNIGYVGDIGEKVCGRCHEVGDPSNTVASGGGAHYQRHPSSSAGLIVMIGGRDLHTDAAHWGSGEDSGFSWDGHEIPRVPFAVSSAMDYSTAKTVSADNEVFCLSCHKAHGSVHAFGMVWSYGTGEAELGNSGCNQCHNTAG